MNQICVLHTPSSWLHRRQRRHHQPSMSNGTTLIEQINYLFILVGGRKKSKYIN